MDDNLGRADTIRGELPADTGPELEVGAIRGGRYRVMRLLGRGGMGRVYLATDLELDELTALKLLPSVFASNADAIEGLRREVKLARRVTHRNVARVFDLGEHDGRYFLTMEFIDGSSLAERLDGGAWLPPSEAAPMLAAAARGLHAVHRAGVVHRDVKPENILVSEGGRVVVSDFGIAKPRGAGTEDGFVLGTPAYMSPEQVRGEPATPRSDVFSLGVTAFRALTGALPWQGDNRVELAEARLHTEAADCRAVQPEIPRAVARVVARALARPPESRYGSADELARAFEEAVPEARSQSTTRFAPLKVGPEPRADKMVVALLPIENRCDADGEAIAAVLTEELIDGLCQLPGLRVLSYGAIRDLEHDSAPHEAAAKLGCAIVLSGALSSAADGFSLKLRAIECAHGYQTWTERFALEPERLLHTVNQIVAAAAPALSHTEDELSPRDEVPGPAAVEIYIRARAAYQDLGRLGEAVELFQEALTLAPDSGLLNAGFAMAMFRQWMLMSRDEAGIVVRATAAARKAIATSPHMGEPHLALGYLHLHTGDPVAATREFRNAVARAPSLADAHGMLGSILVELGRLGDAEQRLAIARRLNPTLTIAASETARVAALRGEYDSAWEQLKQPVLQPTTPVGYFLPVRIAAYQGNIDRIARVAERLQGPGDQTLGIARLLAQCYLGRADPARAFEVLNTDDVGVSARRVTFGLQLRAELAGFLGDDDMVIESLLHGDRVGLVDRLWVDRCPLLDQARSDPRFASVAASIAERAHAAYDAYRA